MHTKKPWGYVDGGQIESVGKRRIVAAIRACEGIPVKALEKGVIKALVEVLKDITFLASLEYRNFTVTYDDAVIARAKAVLEKIEGGSK